MRRDEQPVEGDRQIAYALAGRVIDGVAQGARNAGDADLADPAHTQRMFNAVRADVAATSSSEQYACVVLHDHAMSFPTAFEHWTFLALLRSQAAIADVAADPPSFEDQSDPIEFFRAATLDQQHVAGKQELA